MKILTDHKDLSLLLLENCDLFQDVSVVFRAQENKGWAGDIFIKDCDNYFDVDGVIFQKPIRVITLISTLQDIINSSYRYQINNYLFFPTRLVVSHGLQEILFTEKEFAVFQYLAKCNQVFVAQQDLLQNVFGYHDMCDTSTLKTHISRIRSKILQSGMECIIEHRNGKYKLDL